MPFAALLLLALLYSPFADVGEEAVTLAGNGISDTQPFELAGGNYLLDWTAQSQTQSLCFYGTFLKSVDQHTMKLVADAQVQPGDAQSGESVVYNLEPGQYYASVVSNCNWTLTVAPLT